MSHVYALHDSNPKEFPMQRIHPNQAKEFNEKGFGIFWTVNDFRGPRRITNLKKIVAWAIDIDKGTKAQMKNRIEAGLIPTMVIETKSGFHVYWKAKDAKTEHWDAIVSDRLVPFYGADKNARDLARILRVPGYYHLKNPTEPFLVEKVWEWDVGYTEMQMVQFYPVAREVQQREFNKIKKETKETDSFWDVIWNLDCEGALTKLSGHPSVGCEIYSFNPNRNGTKQIFVNGKSTSCWIDREGKIGSLSNGGPTIAQWLHWFHRDYKSVVQILREVFPACQKK